MSAAIALAMAQMPASAVTASERLDNPAGVWVHPKNGTIFPRMIAQAERTSITQFDDEGRDVSAGYRFVGENGTLAVTVYVYPSMSGFDCNDTYMDARAAIDRYSGARMIAENAAPSPGGRPARSAMHARYLLPAGSYSQESPALVSDLYLHCAMDRGWLVKYRASWTGSAETFPDVMAMMQQIGWAQGLD